MQAMTDAEARALRPLGKILPGNVVVLGISEELDEDSAAAYQQRLREILPEGCHSILLCPRAYCRGVYEWDETAIESAILDALPPGSSCTVRLPSQTSPATNATSTKDPTEPTT